MAAVGSSGTAALRALIESRLRGRAPGGDPFEPLVRGLTREQVADLRSFLPQQFKRAAVLVPIVERESGLSLLLTQRASHLKNHPGQVSFPGGGIEAGDASPWEAALRETEEEIGLGREHVSLVGYLADQFVMTGYIVTPAVAFVRPDFELRLDVTEVDEVFEVPLEFALDPANHVARERHFAGHTLVFHDIPYQGHNIWGATASMVMSFYRLLRGTDT